LVHRAKAAGDAEKSIVRWGFKSAFTPGDTPDCGGGLLAAWEVRQSTILPVLKAFTCSCSRWWLGKRQEPEVGTGRRIARTSASLLMGACRDGGPLKRSDKLLNPRRCFRYCQPKAYRRLMWQLILVSEDSLISVEDSLASGRRSEIGKECGVAAGVLL
jgi:hypothetical protein